MLQVNIPVLPTAAPVGTSITFTATSSGGVTPKVRWDFGDGTSSGWSTSLTASHAYSQAGLYFITLTARDDTGANVTLGQVYLQTRQFEEAAAAFRVAVAAEPYNVSGAYNLGVALTRAGKREEGQEAMARFQKLRDSAYKSALGSNYLEQGKYAEALASMGAEPEDVDPNAPAVSFAEKDEALAGPSTLALADLDADGVLDAVGAGKGGLRVLRGEANGFVDVTEKAGLAGK